MIIQNNTDASILAEQVFEYSSDGIFITDEHNRILRVNRAFTSITGYSAPEIIGKNPRIFSSGRQGKAFYEAMWGEINTRGRWQGEIINRRKNGEIYHQWLSISVVRDSDGRIHRHIAIISDITKYRTAEERVRWLAHHDPLTGLFSRNVLEDRLDYTIQRAKRYGSKAAVLMLDLDDFKPVNDSHGHGFGDQVLVEVAARLSDCVRETDTLARVGGDEFVVLLPDIEDRQHAVPVADKIIRTVCRPYDINGIEVTIGISIGISILPEDGVDTATLLSCADRAMYRMKKQRKNSYGFYSNSLSIKAG